jgi:hypothetical protein
MVLIKEGKEIPSPYYICPSCGKSAGVSQEAKSESDDIPQAKSFVIKEGRVEKES